MSLKQDEFESQSNREHQLYVSNITQEQLDRGYGSATTGARRLANHLLLRVTAVIKQYQTVGNAILTGEQVSAENCQEKLWMTLLDAKVIALITVRRAFDGFLARKDDGQPLSATAVAGVVGNSIFDEIMATALKSGDKKLWNRLVASSNWKTKTPSKKHTVVRYYLNKNDLPVPNLIPRSPTKTELIQLGGAAIAAIDVAQPGLLIPTSRKSIGKHRGVRCFSFSPETYKIIDDLNQSHIALASPKLPTIEPPIPWTEERPGGWHDSRFRPSTSRLILNSNDAYQEQFRRVAGSEALAALNDIQTVPFRLNENVYEVMKVLAERRYSIGKFRYDGPIEVPDCTATTKEEQEEYNKMATSIYDHNALLLRRNAATMQLMRASQAIEGKVFYLPSALDWRGRIYYQTQSIDPQAADPSRALLYFKEEGPINMSWLSRAAATTYGLDKASWAEREQWAQDNMSMLLRVGVDPMGHLSEWEAAYEPWQFLAICCELSEIQSGKTTSGLPIGLDATNSGMQIHAALTRDAATAAMVNLLDADTPADAYKEVLEAIQAAMPELAHKVDRKDAKNIVMPRIYSATRYSARLKLRERRDDKRREIIRAESTGSPKLDDLLTGNDIKRIVDYAYQHAMPDVLPSLERNLTALQAMVKHSPTRKWSTPTGLRLDATVENQQSIQYQTLMFGGTQLRVNASVPGSVSLPETVSGFPANYTHSLDAALMHRVILARQGRPLAVIHDCLLMRSSDADVFSALVREEFIRLYKEPLLERLAADLQVPLPKELELGELDLDAIRGSRFFFS
ncbi:DNA-directed RNA polymerase [Synechococcus sp. CBW1107]|uniref:DNA-directed RNA polymerase n=1 Tax=Synechococcus sp. CBW1107 TaxID=2789857 RepID=UPI002AD5B12B|nr:DNA-directed RNA polymerase [Synechococcus sp. CBW1107]CAK6687169.1 hypothetical protein ICNINCKA_00150 [Synechococcus sp. CBW1107]